jgi:hypothetical protein
MSISLQLTLVFGIPAAAADGHAPENDSIRRDHLKTDRVFLAGDGFRGRLTATPENSFATEFVASRFSRLGLRPVATDGSFYLRYFLSRRRRRTATRSRCWATAEAPHWPNPSSVPMPQADSD